ncbi:putative nicotinate-nucleotide adenylyltransferase [Sporotomaculum syntrophicum]|uniref:bis(5'-nucleosyl)-tetraphosphatase (symmetrical) n=1 Tax=Sporotomaculum syntrophicum TaxID=182264 RepID=A0A9D2WNC8_9FIRM|nr:bis(5'-nucleosyl)-tetraphosphatase (symmetrical) YqeK [Sporotomaculum syntrophicum]KAF1084459.1 putative nicotinate-nucleotide adenylyltransferase [Sporotomaculum syntrophicum]
MQHKYYIERLQGMLGNKRLEHSLAVSATAVGLAELYGADRRQAEMAGLLHDCARELSDVELLAMARENHVPVVEVEELKPVLLHAPVGALLARRQFGVLDQAVLQSINLHTLGDAAMTLLDKIVFLADKTEPGRNYPGVDKLRQLATQNLDQALLYCFDNAILLAVRRGELIHPRIVQARNGINIFNRRQEILNLSRIT